MQLNAEGFVDEVLINNSTAFLNAILKDIEEGRDKAANLYSRSVYYGLSLSQAQICIKYFLQRIEEILGKSIEQIIKEYEFKDLANLLDSETLANFRNKSIEFVVNCSVEDRSPNELKEEKITRLHLAIHNHNFSNVFSPEVIRRISDFFSNIIDENKIDEINFICNMIDNLSLDNITDDNATKYDKLVIFLNDFMFRKNNIIKFIDISFKYPISFLYEILKDRSRSDDIPSMVCYNINISAIENYVKFILDALQLILGYTIDLNCDKSINELLEQEILDIFKEETITFIINYGSEFYDYKNIWKECTCTSTHSPFPFLIPSTFISTPIPIPIFVIQANSANYFFNKYFDMKTPIYLIEEMNSSGEKFFRIEQIKQISKLVNYFHNMISTNPTQFPNEGIINVTNYLIEVSEINYDKSAINSILNLKSAEILLQEIDETCIKNDDLNNFFFEFDQKHPGIMRELIPQQANLNNQRNLLP